MRVRLLGPVDVVVDGVVQPVGGLRRRAVLAVLGLAGGEVVSIDRLIDAVWDGRPPDRTANALQRHVSQLRAGLGAHAAIVTSPPGYRLDPGGHTTDVAEAVHLIERARRATDPDDRRADLDAALALWRGAPLADLAGLSWLDTQAARLTDLRLDALEGVYETRLALGEHAAIVPELAEMARQHPYRERLHGHLMLALYRCGRQADALAAGQRLRRQLVDDLGIDPGAGPRALEAAILRQDPALDPVPPAVPATPPAAPRAAHPPPAAHPPAPRQLPADLPGFIGRAEQLAALDRRMATVGHEPVVCLLWGTAGVGKSVTAVHWAHTRADRFPDGQLYVNLRGFDPAGAPLDPAEAVAVVLDSLGVSARRVPPVGVAQEAMYRALLAERRMLIVLDNARDAEQVRPLLPGGTDCAVVVTSRARLTGLIASGAHPHQLDLLAADEGVELLRCRLGEARVGGEPAAVREIVDRCARLPLALAIVAARAAAEPSLSLGALTNELSERGGVLDSLDGGDAQTDLRAVFSWSCRQLSPAAARLFRLLGQHPGGEITRAAAASLAGLAPARVRPLLAELVRASLLTMLAIDRYGLHDLLRAYAADLGATGARGERRAAVRRILDHYLHTADRAEALVSPERDRFPLPAAASGVTVEPPADWRRAQAWFVAEQAALLGALDLAETNGFDDHVWRLACVTANFVDRHGLWSAAAVAGRAAVRATDRLGRPGARARALRLRAHAHMRLDRLDDAEADLRAALELYDHDDRVERADVLATVAALHAMRGRYSDHMDYARRALVLYRSAGHRRGVGVTLNSIGWVEALLGDHRRALARCRQALSVLNDPGDRFEQAQTWDTIGYVHHHSGRATEAVGWLARAVDTFAELGERFPEADTLDHLGDAHLSAGDPGAARAAWHRAATILTELGHALAVDVRAKLHALTVAESSKG